MIDTLISKNINSKIIECVGHKTITFKEIIEILKLNQNKVANEWLVGYLSAKFFQLFPNPLLTQDQLRLLKYDNINFLAEKSIN